MKFNFAVEQKTRFSAGLSGLSCGSESAFLALLCELLFAFFGVNENVVRIAEMLFPFLTGFAMTTPIVKLELVQVFEKLLVKFGLQFLGETWEKFSRFRSEQPGSVQGLK